MWQFVKGTGRLYGLAGNFWYAERRLQREMFDVLSASGPMTGDGAVNTLIDAWQETRGHVVGAQRQLVAIISGPSAGRPAEEVRKVIARESSLLDRRAEEVLRAAPSLGPCFRVGTAGVVEVQRTLPPATVVLFPPELIERQLLEARAVAAGLSLAGKGPGPRLVPKA
jgi:hypothetical protein